MRTMLAALMVIVASGGMATSVVHAAEAPGTDTPALIAAASSAYNAGIEKLENSPTAAKADFQSSVAAYRAVIADRGVESGPLWYNLGNAYMMSGDTGRAIAAYLRAQRLMPTSQSLAANLAGVRTRVAASAITPAKEPTWAAAASFT